MPSDLPEELTMMLNAAARGDGDSAERIWCTIYADLRQAASVALGTPKLGERRSPGPTTIVEKVFLRLHAESTAGPGGAVTWENRKDFFVAIAREMSRFLVELRTNNPTFDRGGFARVLPLGLDFDAIGSFDAALRATDAGVFESLAGLEKDHAAAAEVVWLRYVCGLTIDQTAELLGIKSRTVCKYWNYARAWIRRDLDSRFGRSLPEKPGDTRGESHGSETG